MSFPDSVVSMMTEVIVAIDAGTSGVRSIFFDTLGKVLSMAYQEFDSQFPSPSWVEQKAPSWWNTACKILKKAFKTSDINPDDVVGVSVTNQRETVVPVDNKGQALRNAIVWQDRRTTNQCDWIREKIPSNEIYSITGLTVDPYFTAPKILWIKEKEPHIFKKTDKFLLVHDYFIYRLTGEYVTDYSNASRTMLFDISKTEWSAKI
ncbi:MAG: FGGY family carbohydrate kinase, partial [Candidatus Thorarchaeota archaeon]|nr:FGGY family carbohydrate kinase [Candidatus Thorarchaeota archaeon]